MFLVKVLHKEDRMSHKIMLAVPVTRVITPNSLIRKEKWIRYSIGGCRFVRGVSEVRTPQPSQDDYNISQYITLILSNTGCWCTLCLYCSTLGNLWCRVECSRYHLELWAAAFVAYSYLPPQCYNSWHTIHKVVPFLALLCKKTE